MKLERIRLNTEICVYYAVKLKSYHVSEHFYSISPSTPTVVTYLKFPYTAKKHIRIIFKNNERPWQTTYIYAMCKENLTLRDFQAKSGSD